MSSPRMGCPAAARWTRIWCVRPVRGVQLTRLAPLPQAPPGMLSPAERLVAGGLAGPCRTRVRACRPELDHFSIARL